LAGPKRIDAVGAQQRQNVRHAPQVNELSSGPAAETSKKLILINRQWADFQHCVVTGKRYRTGLLGQFYHFFR
jgi:hypothetical protein